MQATLLRSHVREEALAVEAGLDYAIDRLAIAGNLQAALLVGGAIAAHHVMKFFYDKWDYKTSLYAALVALSFVDRALTAMGEPDHIHDPIRELGLTPFE